MGDDTPSPRHPPPQRDVVLVVEENEKEEKEYDNYGEDPRAMVIDDGSISARVREVERAEWELTAWVDCCRRSGGRTSSSLSLIVDDFDCTIVDGELAIRWGEDEDCATDARAFEDVIGSLLLLPSSILISSMIVNEQCEREPNGVTGLHEYST